MPDDVPVGWIRRQNSAELQAVELLEVVAPLGVLPVPDLLLANLRLLVDEQRTEDDGPALALQLLGLDITALASRVRPEEVGLGRVVGVQGAEEVEVRLRAEAVWLGERGGAVAELVGGLDVQQGVRYLLELGSCRGQGRQDHQDHRGDLQEKEREKKSQLESSLWNGRCE